MEVKSLRNLLGVSGALTAVATGLSVPLGYAAKAFLGTTSPAAINGSELGIVALIGSCLGGLAYLGFRTLPMRMLNSALEATQRINDELRHLAHHDPLTHLPNRALFQQELEQALASSEPFALLFLDLDRFKVVNDTLGHPIGDALLSSVALRLRALVGDRDTLIRLGGDEFAIIQRSAIQPQAATQLAERIIAAVSKPYEFPGRQIDIGTSVGIAIAPVDGQEPTRLLKCADMALYRAKDKGRGTYHVFERSMAVAIQARHALERDLQVALEQHEFEVHFQPLVSLKTRTVTGFEALVRWRHPVRGHVPPSDFIPVAEETGMIIPIGAWVLAQACEVAAWWPEGIKVAVNLSAVQFRSSLVDDVVRTLQRTGLAPHRLELEITEGVLLQDTQQTLATLHQLREHGVRFSLDDFGTGYSSLSYLRSFPFDKIKIDRSFVKDLPSGESLAIINAITGLARNLNVTTTAEGVETVDQLERLAAEGCDEVQGYIFSAPRPALELPKIMMEIAGQSGTRELVGNASRKLRVTR